MCKKFSKYLQKQHFFWNLKILQEKILQKICILCKKNASVKNKYLYLIANKNQKNMKTKEL
ncbi:hypothetical protein D0817_14680 [Flavobacterium cupreum]|uniref:Uncharacterized protein n=1 Tax=Flavobacterium cupreum TaxID=2133766 RepID=A0A434A630_9FLAO|nr:hypothetical protein D0817_14680 [Flavobacterium cupreum]